MRKPLLPGGASPGVMADASELKGLPREEFEAYEISRIEFEAFRSS